MRFDERFLLSTLFTGDGFFGRGRFPAHNNARRRRKQMNVRFPSRLLMVIAGAIVLSQTVNGQNSTQLFAPVYARQSASTTTYSLPFIFSSTTVSLTCGASPTATISGPMMLANGSGPSGATLQPGGNLLVDNNVLVTVTPSGGAAGATQNVCVGSDVNDGSWGPSSPNPPNLTNNCFNSVYRANVGAIIGQNPDTYTIYPVVNGVAAATLQTPDFFGGVGPIDISSNLASAANKQANVVIALDDEGGYLVSSTLFLTTNCTINGVLAGSISGNPITGSQNLGTTQSFTFNSNTGGQKGVQFGYDVSGAFGDLGTNVDGAIPQVADSPVNPSTFQSVYVPGTSFATSNCLVHSGEVLADGVTPGCKIYTLDCLNPNNNTLAGANCPVSSKPNEVAQDVFDGPQFKLPDIHTKAGVVHEGIGFLMASETWPGAGVSYSNTNCTFEVDSGLQNLPCPLNFLNSFTGPGGFGAAGGFNNPNSEFIAVYGVPQDLTTVFVAGQNFGNWVNTSTPTITFITRAPNLIAGGGYPYIVNQNGNNSGNNAVPVPGATNYVPQPIKSITFGFSPANMVPSPASEPTLMDTVLNNPATNCPTGNVYTTKTIQPNFGPVSPNPPVNLPDGQYALHYYAQDCAGTQELDFDQAPHTGSWSTNFYTIPLNVDTQAPTVTITSPPASGNVFTRGQVVKVNYNCTDAGFVPGGLNTGSGVVACGTHNYSVGTTFSTGNLQTTFVAGASGKFTVIAVDGAGNTNSATVTYTLAH
jgi:hypothetical protein